MIHAHPNFYITAALDSAAIHQKANHLCPAVPSCPSLKTPFLDNLVTTPIADRIKKACSSSLSGALRHRKEVPSFLLPFRLVTTSVASSSQPVEPETDKT
jgi:hypothetical protein